MARESPLQSGFKSHSHKRRSVRFNGLWRVHRPPQPRTAHTAAHRAKQGRFERGDHYPRTVLRGSETLRGQGVNGVLCSFLVLAGCAPKERREPSGQRCAHARRCSEASRPCRAAYTYAANISIFPAEFFSQSQKTGKKSYSLIFCIHVFDRTA